MKKDSDLLYSDVCNYGCAHVVSGLDSYFAPHVSNLLLFVVMQCSSSTTAGARHVDHLNRAPCADLPDQENGSADISSPA